MDSSEDSHLLANAATTHPTLNSFTLFQRLPKELRDNVWELAAEQYIPLPRVHYFTLECQPYKKFINTDSYGAFLPGKFVADESLGNEWEKRTYTCNARREHSAEDDLYLALTRACAESRSSFYRVMEKYDPQHPAFGAGQNIVKIKSHARQRFTLVNVERDMIALELVDLWATNGSAIYAFTQSLMWGGCTLKNVGVVYDDIWLWEERRYESGWVTAEHEWPALTTSRGQLSGFAKEMIQLSWAGMESIWMLEMVALDPWTGIRYSKLVDSARVFCEPHFRWVEVLAYTRWEVHPAASELDIAEEDEEALWDEVTPWRLCRNCPDHIFDWTYILQDRFDKWMENLNKQGSVNPQPQLLLPMNFAARVDMAGFGKSFTPPPP